MPKKKKSTEPVFSAGILVTMTRAELNEINAAVPDGTTASAWCRKVLLELVRPKTEKGDDLKDGSAA